MQETNMEDLPKTVLELPIKAKKMFLKAYEKTQDLNKAWSVVKDFYTKKDNKWVLKSTVKMSSVIAKSGFMFNPSYYIPVKITDTMADSVGHKPTKTLLNKLVSSHKVHTYGDVDHSKLNGDNRSNKLYTLIDYNFDGSSLVGKIVINKTHPKYKEMVEYHRDGKYLGLSAEFYDPILDEDGNIVDCSELGWTVTDEPENKRAIMGE